MFYAAVMNDCKPVGIVQALANCFPLHSLDRLPVHCITLVETHHLILESISFIAFPQVFDKLFDRDMKQSQINKIKRLIDSTK